MYADIYRDMTRIPSGLDRNLASLERFSRARMEQRVADVVAAREANIARASRPFKRYAQVDLWAAQYSQCLDRYCFLLIEGPSRLGKTAFVHGLVPPGTVYEVSLTGGALPDLRDYRPDHHRLLFFDEATPKQAIELKKLLQAPLRPIDCGTSTTNLYAFKIYVGGKRICLASNDWSAKLRRLPAEDRDWLNANCFHLRVSTPMFQEDLPAF